MRIYNMYRIIVGRWQAAWSAAPAKVLKIICPSKHRNVKPDIRFSNPLLCDVIAGCETIVQKSVASVQPSVSGNYADGGGSTIAHCVQNVNFAVENVNRPCLANRSGKAIR